MSESGYSSPTDGERIAIAIVVVAAVDEEPTTKLIARLGRVCHVPPFRIPAEYFGRVIDCASKINMCANFKSRIYSLTRSRLNRPSDFVCGMGYTRGKRDPTCIEL